MIKILIVSDSHGLTKELSAIRARHLNEVELMIHCGDSQLMMDEPPMAGFLAVRGNCDFDTRYPLERIQEISGRKVYITHGHKYSVKTSLMSITYRARELNANIVCFGHSHVLGAAKIEDIFFINPGSIRLPRERREKTYVILELAKEKIGFSVYDVNGKVIPGLSREFAFLE